MALSGNLETFSLPDVLRLLASTKKTGVLALDGDRGHGRIWVRDGAIVAADADRAVSDDIDGVAFELLRFSDAEFRFETGAEATTEVDAREVDGVLDEAGSRLEEWREIEAVVPSLDVWVRMVAEVDDDVTMSPSRWRVLARVGTGATGHAIAEHLGQGEYDVCRQLRDLIVDGVVELDEDPAPERVSSLGAGLASFVAVGTADDPVGLDVAGPFDAMVHTGGGDTAEPSSSWADEVVEVDEEGDEQLSQLSQLSPKAAAAVEAMWTADQADTVGAPADTDPDADADGSGPAVDDIGQNLLLRFLSSTKQ